MASTSVRASATSLAQDRAVRLCDPGTFAATGSLRRSSTRSGQGAHEGDGVVTGVGEVDGRLVAVASHEFAHAGGSIGSGFAAKVTALQDLAMARGLPIVYLNDSGGARIGEGIESLAGCGEIFRRNVVAREVVPQVSAILGPCAGAAAYSPALTDWTVMVRGQSRMFLTGPDVVRQATGEEVTADDIGGAELHTTVSGVAHLAVDSEPAALESVRALLGYLPSRTQADLPLRRSRPPTREAELALPTLLPARSSQVFDMARLLAGVVDGSRTLELMAGYGPSVITGLARLGGVPVGIVASQPARRGGILEIHSARKIARFVRFCGRIGLPVITFLDVPGFLPGTRQESGGIISEGAEVLDAYVAARCPRLTIVVRKAYGGAFIALGSKSLGADFAWAWPDAELAVMGPGAAVGILHRRELAAAADPEAERARLAQDYIERVTRPAGAAESGIIDDIITPDQTRETLLTALRLWHPSAERARRTPGAA